MNITRRMLCLAGLAALSSLWFPQFACAAGEKLVLGYPSGNSIYWDLDVAIDKGFLAEEGFAPEVIVPASSPQTVQLLVTGNLHVGATQPEPFVAAVEKGASSIGAIAAPMNYADWTLNVRPDVKTLADLKGKVIGVSALKNSEVWQTTQLLTKAGLKPDDFTFIVAGTSPTKITALEKGSIAAAVLFQPSGQLAASEGLQPLAYYSDLRAYPPILYGVNREWAAKNDAGKRFTRALTKAHEWLQKPENKAEAIAILKKATKRDDAILANVYDIYFSTKKIYSATGAIELSGLDRAIADMAADGEILKTPTPGAKYLIPREQGGLYH